LAVSWNKPPTKVLPVMGSMISAKESSLKEGRAMVLAAEKNPQVKTRFTTPILNVIDNIGNEILQDIPELLDKLQLSHTMRYD